MCLSLNFVSECLNETVKCCVWERKRKSGRINNLLACKHHFWESFNFHWVCVMRICVRKVDDSSPLNCIFVLLYSVRNSLHYSSDACWAFTMEAPGGYQKFYPKTPVNFTFFFNRQASLKLFFFLINSEKKILTAFQMFLADNLFSRAHLIRKLGWIHFTEDTSSSQNIYISSLKVITQVREYWFSDHEAIHSMQKFWWLI